MKKLSILLSILLLVTSIYGQTITGKLVDHENNALGEITLKLYSGFKVYDATSNTDGTFIFNNVTDVKTEEELPTGYEISSNYPNPFNPLTRINITLPIVGNVKVDVYNVLGQQVINTINKNFGAGISSIDIELNGLPNGIYLAKINIDEQYSVIRKLMLIYGSNHLSTSAAITNSFSYHSGSGLNKTSLATTLDSLVATSAIIGKKVFTNLPNYSGVTLNLGNLTIERYCLETPTVTYAGKTYNTVQICTQCWLKENLDVGSMIQGTQNPSNNSTIEKYCYDNKTENCDKYGGLYQWTEAMAYSTTPGTKGICPDGWHIPTKAEFETLAKSSAVNEKSNTLKAIGQGTGSTNTSGFSALLAGYRGSSSSFYSLGYYPYFWSSTEYNAPYACNLGLSYYHSGIYFDGSDKGNGFSVRCLKD